MTKKCFICSEIKDSSEFHHSSVNKDGLHSYCNKCNTSIVYKNQKERLKTDSEFKLVENFKASFRLFRKGRYKGFSKILGYTRTELFEYLEMMNRIPEDYFTEPNRNKYNFDHIRPLSSFPKTLKGLIESYRPSNLRIITAVENRKKGYKV